MAVEPEPTEPAEPIERSEPTDTEGARRPPDDAEAHGLEDGEGDGDKDGDGDEDEDGDGDRDHDHESTLAMLRRFRRELPRRPSLDEAIELFESELPLEVHDREAVGPGPDLLGRRSAIEVTRGRRISFTVTYAGAVQPKVVTLELCLPRRRLVRHARQGFVDVHGFVLDEVFEIDELLGRVVDWWSPEAEHHSWP